MTESFQTPSYILKCDHKALKKFVLNQINQSTYFKTSFLRKYYISISKNLKQEQITDITAKSVSNIIGKIIGDLNKLGLVERDNSSNSLLWRNLYKNELFNELDKSLKGNYLN